MVRLQRCENAIRPCCVDNFNMDVGPAPHDLGGVTDEFLTPRPARHPSSARSSRQCENSLRAPVPTKINYEATGCETPPVNGGNALTSLIPPGQKTVVLY